MPTEKSMYSVKIEKEVEKTLQKINEPYFSKIKTAILNLAHDPRPYGYKKLKGRDGYRIRIADYRIIYDIFDDVLVVQVIGLRHRRNIYE
ncbi:MAG TPA: type II toxin-antitoxin system RelE/ParE family toxin [Mucilaginibacter sp.]|jgi:mRNA interferase RelE/StbE